MQVTIDFSQVTMPTYEPYDKSRPEQQRENLAYVALQLLDQARQNGVKVTYTDNDDQPIGLELDGVQQATKDLKWNGQTIDILGLCKVILTNRAVSVEWGG